MCLAEGIMGMHPNFHCTYHLPSSQCAGKGDVLQIVCVYYPYTNIGATVKQLCFGFFSMF